jgi:hypothetical protein
VSSYGVGGHVKLPGASAGAPNKYEFGTPYETIFNDLKAKDEALYTRNGLLAMLARNMGVKRAPEKWQHTRCACGARLHSREPRQPACSACVRHTRSAGGDRRAR